MDREYRIASLQATVEECYEIARASGFWDNPEDQLLIIKAALIASEVGELVDAARKPAPSEHIPNFTNAEEELADIVIRCFDHGHGLGLRVVEAVFAKMDYNRTRSYRHGNKQY